MDYLVGLKNQNKRITARLMSLIENNDPRGLELLTKIYSYGGHAFLIGITGSPGSGKSSLINHLIHYYRKKELTVGVVAVDPTSSFSGGALLGDRIRMNDFTLDSKVFIRSMATRGQLGGLASTTSAIIHVLDAYGCDIILIETVGIGQSEVDIVEIADTVLVVLMPGIGDEIQTNKAGILEIADIFVLNKSDLEGKDQLKINLRQSLDLDSKIHENSWIPPIIETYANQRQNSGVDSLVKQINQHREFLDGTRKIQLKKEKRALKEFENILLNEFLREIYNQITPQKKNDLILSIATRKLDPYSAVKQILENYVYKS
ncbi:MAG: methylmalonyl Co-A mutase-associated GTPase MeaB [Candidatus Hodarchaeales archaeon]|jgi:LAO/AO transport system kinase